MALEIGEYVLALDGSALPSKDLIGGKAWSIARMSALELRVPPAIVVTTRACIHFLEHGSWPPMLADEIGKGVEWLEKQSSRTFGAGEHPLLVSVRSGAPISMPGMMDTVLNLGINAQSETSLAAECGDPAFARDTHRRFLELYAHIVFQSQVELDPAGTPAGWQSVIGERSGRAVPTDVYDQLRSAIEAVFQSWNSRRAKRYRQHHAIPDTLGTAVTIQAMVFGNMDDSSGTGVLFSRNPLTGEDRAYGEFMRRAQGEDIVSGKRTPETLDALRADNAEVHAELLSAASLLERENGDVQDIEFTIERGKLYLLQTRAAKRAPQAAVRIVVEMANAGVIDKSEALLRLSAEQIRSVLSPRLAESAFALSPIVTGEAASPGIGIGVVVVDSDEAERATQSGQDVVLARKTTSPEDLHGMLAAKAVVTEQGGSTSHAAVVSRALGRPCVVGCGEDTLAGLAGEVVTVDGGSGKIYRGSLPVITPSEDQDPLLVQITEWARDLSPIEVKESWPGDGAADFDAHVDGYDGLIDGLAAGAVVRGQLFANDNEAVRKVIEAGASTIITSPSLPALITAVHVAAATQDSRK